MKSLWGLLSVCLMAVTTPWALNSVFLGISVPVYWFTFIVLVTLFRISASHTIHVDRPFLALLTYFFLICISFTWSLLPSLAPSMLWVLCIVAYFGTLNFCREDKSVRWFVYSSALAALITLPMLAPYEGQELLTTSRYAVPGHNANFTAYVLAGIFFVIVLSLRYMKHSQLAKLFLFLSIAVILLELALLGTRGAQISVILVSIVLFLGRWVPKSTARFASISLLVVGFSFSVGWLTPILLWVDSLSARSTGDLSGRTIIWADALQYVLANPLLGIGPGSFLEFGMLKIGVHNIFLFVLLECGIVGMAVFLWFLHEVRKALRSQGKEGPRVFLAFLVYWLPMAVSGHWESAPYSWGIIALAINVARLRAKSAAQTELSQAELVVPLALRIA